MSYGDDTPKEARENGFDAAFYGEPYDNPYKNFNQAQEYRDGYESGKAERKRLDEKAV